MRLVTIVALVSALLLPAAANAASERIVIRKSRAAILNSWTPAAILAAQPKWVPVEIPEASPASVKSVMRRHKGVQKRSGSPPRIELTGKGLSRQLAPPRPKSANKDQWRKQATGSFGGLYSQTALFPPELATVYPYRSAGKLFFRDTITGNGAICSASIIAPRILVTAAHCLFDQTNGVFYADWVFAPGYYNGTAPLGVWTPTGGGIPESYVTIPGVVHPEDFGILVLGDLNAEGQVFRVGDIVGWYGVVLSDITTHFFHVDFLGYPANLDGGEIMQRTGAQTLGTFEPNNALYGSDQGGGSSGGPYVIDLQYPAAGGIDRLPTVVAVESFGNDVGDVGVSLLNANFLSLLEGACAAAAGNC